MCRYGILSRLQGRFRVVFPIIKPFLNKEEDDGKATGRDAGGHDPEAFQRAYPEGVPEVRDTLRQALHALPRRDGHSGGTGVPAPSWSYVELPI